MHLLRKKKDSLNFNQDRKHIPVPEKFYYDETL